MATLVGHKLQVWFDWLNEESTHRRDQSACRSVYLQDVLLDLLYQSLIGCIIFTSTCDLLSFFKYLERVFFFTNVSFVVYAYDQIRLFFIFLICVLVCVSTFLYLVGCINKMSCCNIITVVVVVLQYSCFFKCLSFVQSNDLNTLINK